VTDLLVQLGEAVIHSQSGHIQIGKAGYFDVGSRTPARYVITAREAQPITGTAISGVDTMMRRIAFSGLLSNGRSALPIVGEGIEPDPEARLGTRIALLQGRALRSGDRHHALVGEGLARAMRIQPGSVVSLVAPTIDDAMNTIDVEVVGVFQSFSKDYDDRALKIPLGAVQELLNTDGFNILVVLLADTKDTARVASEISTRGQSSGLEVRTWDALNDFYWKSVALYERQFGVLQLIVFFMVMLAVAGAVNVSVRERESEFGTMRALGNRSTAVVALVFIEAVLLGLAGACAGALLGCAGALGISALGIPMPPPPNSNLAFTGRIALDVAVVARASILGLLATAAASLVPAFRASRLPIVEALRRAV
jgi:putative ABC transport system permease protein